MKKLAESIISNGIILAICTFIGYVLAYQYETAYLSYFGIPKLFANIEISMAIKITISLATIALIIMWISAFLLNIIPYKKDSYFQMPILCTITYFVISVSVSTFQFVYGGNIKDVWNWSIISILILWVGYLLYPIFTQRKTKGLKNKFIQAHEKLEFKKNKGKTKETYLSKIPTPIVFIFLFLNIFFFLNLLATNMGKSTAKEQHTFSFSDKYENYCLIALKGDSAILAQYENGDFTKSYLVISQSELGYLKQIRIDE